MGMYPLLVRPFYYNHKSRVEYRITLSREQHLTRFHLEIERRSGTSVLDQALAGQARSLLRNRHGVAPHAVTVLEDGALPRAIHKAKRVVDNR